MYSLPGLADGLVHCSLIELVYGVPRLEFLSHSCLGLSMSSFVGYSIEPVHGQRFFRCIECLGEDPSLLRQQLD
jgi:hypothetical protein